jgi:hypothetical protein
VTGAPGAPRERERHWNHRRERGRPTFACLTPARIAPK